ncbi:MAG TPA: RluA family pseudouridine synthase [Candidatus Binataceae bacterium]|nr:RluA family pseudouridine synthase [Candidatus Binataceae bacterium]
MESETEKTAPQDHERLDRYLVRLGFAGSRRMAREMVESRVIRLNGAVPSKGSLVRPGDRVEVEEASDAVPLVPDSNVTLEILFQDAALIVVNKPGGIPCHPLRPGETGTVMNGVVAMFPNAANAGDNPREGGLVHRLDNGTSGALMVALTAESFAAMRAAIREGRIRRRYQALIGGWPGGEIGTEAGGEIEIKLPIAHHPRNRRRMMVARDESEAVRLGARPARTIVRPIERIGDFTLVDVLPRSGSRHQIRVHLASLGCPIAGDLLYGGPPLESLPDERFWLHLAELDFRSPASGHARVEAGLSRDLSDAIATCR